MVARRVLSVVALAAALVVGGGLATAPPASAHPLGNFTVNRYSGIEVSPGGISIVYVVDMAEIPTFQEMPAVDVDRDGSADPAELRAWAGRQVRGIAARLSLSIDGRPVALEASSASAALRPGLGGLSILTFRAVFSGALPLSGSVRYVDRNGADRIGWREITVRSAGGAAVSDASVPRTSISDGLRRYPQDLLSDPLDVRQATFSVHPGAGGGPGGRPGDTRLGSEPAASEGAFAALVTWRVGPILAIAALLLAFAFGALHALGPGHGKTIMAAYLVGADARLRQAVTVGVAVSLMHTASVIGLGLLTLFASSLFPSERVYPWLGLLTGVVALTLGSGLLAFRYRARRDRRDLGRAHGHPHPETPDRRALSARRLGGLAVSGGILPSPTALVVLLGAIQADRTAYGLALILSFSCGLAAALTVIGVLALRARTMVARRLGARTAGLLPLGSAAVIVAMGAFFTVRGIAQV